MRNLEDRLLRRTPNYLLLFDERSLDKRISINILKILIMSFLYCTALVSALGEMGRVIFVSINWEDVLIVNCGIEHIHPHIHVYLRRWHLHHKLLPIHPFTAVLLNIFLPLIWDMRIIGMVGHSVLLYLCFVYIWPFQWRSPTPEAYLLTALRLEL